MQVMMGQSFEQSDGSWLKVEMQLDSSDLVTILRTWGVEDRLPKMTQSQQHAALAVEAERLLLTQLIAARQHDEQWKNSVAGPQVRDLMLRLAKLNEELKAL